MYLLQVLFSEWSLAVFYFFSVIIFCAILNLVRGKNLHIRFTKEPQKAALKTIFATVAQYEK